MAWAKELAGSAKAFLKAFKDCSKVGVKGSSSLSLSVDEVLNVGFNVSSFQTSWGSISRSVH